MTKKRYLKNKKKHHSPDIFVATVCDEVKGREVRVHCEQVEAQQHGQDLDDHPHQRRAGTQTQHLWTEPNLPAAQARGEGRDNRHGETLFIR